jgi:rRNA maturation protein Rpf1
MLCNSLSGIIPNSKRINRGTSGLKDLILIANNYNSKLFIIIDSRHGNPSRIRFFKIEGVKGVYDPLEIYIKSVDLTPKLSKRKYVDENYDLEIFSLKEGEKIEGLAKNLARLFDANYDINKKGIISSDKIRINSILGHKKQKNRIFLVLNSINKSISISFLINDDFIGPKINVKDFKLKNEVK